MIFSTECHGNRRPTCARAITLSSQGCQQAPAAELEGLSEPTERARKSIGADDGQEGTHLRLAAFGFGADLLMARAMLMSSASATPYKYAATLGSSSGREPP